MTHIEIFYSGGFYIKHIKKQKHGFYFIKYVLQCNCTESNSRTNGKVFGKLKKI